MTVASFIAAQRTDYRIPHAVSCRALEVSESWFYKWRDRRADSPRGASGRPGRGGEGVVRWTRAARRAPTGRPECSRT